MRLLSSCFILELVLATLLSASSADLLLDGGEEFGWDIDNWRMQVDGVMGGLSSGDLQYEDDNSVMYFSGDISLDGGGFSSVRKRFDQAIDLSSYAGIVVELEAHVFDDDEKAPLGLHLQFHDEVSSYGYASAFAVPSAVDRNTTSVFLPLYSFDRASRMGWVCRDVNNCILDTTRIDEMDLYVLFQEGPFEVRIHSITAVQNAASFPSPVIPISSFNQINSLIDDTTYSGGSLFNYGYRELCIAIYRSTLNTLLAATGPVVSNEMKGIICEGLETAAAFDKTEMVDIAWNLRETLDAVSEMTGLDVAKTVASGVTWEGECMAVTSFPPIYMKDTPTGPGLECIQNFGKGCKENDDCCSNYCSTNFEPGYCKPEPPKKSRSKRLCRGKYGGLRQQEDCNKSRRRTLIGGSMEDNHENVEKKFENESLDIK